MYKVIVYGESGKVVMFTSHVQPMSVTNEFGMTAVYEPSEEEEKNWVNNCIIVPNNVWVHITNDDE